MTLDVSRALDTSRSVVVEACAGSGKTWLLSSRIARALVEGVPPRSILALTFTNKAAAEMRLRVVKHLEELANASPEELVEKLSQWGLSGDALHRAVETAPKVLSRYLSDPQPATISTFHSWYIQLAAMAPISTAGWATLALSQKQWDLMHRAWQRFFAQKMSATPYSDLVALLGRAPTQDAMNQWVLLRLEWRAFGGNVQRDKLSQASNAQGIPSSVSELQQQMRQEIDDFYAAHRDQAARFAKAYEGASRRESVHWALTNWQSVHFEALCQSMTGVVPEEDQLIQPNGPIYRAKWADKFVRKEDLTRWGDAASATKDEVLKFIDAICLLRERHARMKAAMRDHALWVCSNALGQCLDEVMAQGHEVDYAVYESIAWDLLVGRFASEFQSRLDTRMTHILVDEFQDTNPVQWAMLKAWFSEYLQDDPAVMAMRPKVFLVGDPKQSIYRFRRADPELFRIACDWLCNHFQAERLVTNATRRCSKAVVDLLNETLPQVCPNDLFQPHETLSDDRGAVARLPLVQGESATSRREEGDQIAQALSALKAANPQLRWSGVRILFRSRNHMEDYEQALADAGIAFISDRTGGLLNEPEVLDLIALLRFLAYSWSDLDLAQALKSPIFGLTDAQLIQIAGAGDAATPLFERLRACAQINQDPAIVSAARTLTDWKQWSEVLPIHDLLDRILHHQDLLSKMAERFWKTRGLQALANIEAFVALALDLDTGKLPSLHRFVQELSRWQRAPATDAPGPGAMPAADAVRLSSLHSAKGLEAEVVILAGLKDRQNGDKGLRWMLRWNASRDEIVSAASWKKGEPLTDDIAKAISDSRAQADQERFNLLYVGMTRAIKILLLSATGETKEPGKISDKTAAIDRDWYDQLLSAPLWDPSGPLLDSLRLVETETAPDDQAPIEPLTAQAFTWPGIQFPVSSVASKAEAEIESLSIRQGKALHRLLEFGPKLQPSAISRLIAEFGLPQDAVSRVVEAVKRVAASDIAQAIFDPERLAYAEQEWPIQEGDVQRLMRPDRVVQIASDPEAWWVIDFKWKVLPSETSRYAAQLASYRREFQRLRPQALVLARILTSDAEVWDLEGDVGQERLVHSA